VLAVSGGVSGAVEITGVDWMPVTVATTLPLPDAVTSPVNAVIPEPLPPKPTGVQDATPLTFSQTYSVLAVSLNILPYDEEVQLPDGGAAAPTPHVAGVAPTEDATPMTDGLPFPVISRVGMEVAVPVDDGA